jgi:hypothetical protein
MGVTYKHHIKGSDGVVLPCAVSKRMRNAHNGHLRRILSLANRKRGGERSRGLYGVRPM